MSSDLSVAPLRTASLSAAVATPLEKQNGADLTPDALTLAAPRWQALAILLTASLLMCLHATDGNATRVAPDGRRSPRPVTSVPLVAQTGAPASQPNKLSPRQAPTEAKESEPTPLHIAVAIPLTGPRRAAGAAVKRRLADLGEAINAKGGVLGRPLLLDVQDDKCDRESAKNLADMIVSATPKPAVVIGHPCPAVAIAAAPIYQQAGLLFIAAGARHPDLTRLRPGPLVFRAAGRDDRQGKDAGDRLSELAGEGGSALIIHDRTLMARRLALAAREASTRTTGKPPAMLAIVAGKNDYSGTIEKIAAAAPRAILFLGFPPEATVLIRQLRQRGLTQTVLLNDAMAGSSFVDQAGALLKTNIEVLMPVSIRKQSAGEPELPSDRFASDAAAALMAWRTAANAIASLEGWKIAEYLNHDQARPDGVAFDASGNAIAISYAPFRLEDNHWRRADAK